MGRARVATDEQIWAAADELAAEIGWQSVVAGKVHARMGVGGSLTTFATVIKAWKAQKEAEAAEAGEDDTAVPEIVEHRASELDSLLATLNEGLADGLDRIRQVATAQIDRTIADERSKADTLRAADRAAHDEVVANLKAHIAALSEDSEKFMTEATDEIDRADNAEAERDALKLRLDTLAADQAALAADKAALTTANETLTSKVADLEKQLADARSQAETAAQTADKRIKAAEERERRANTTADELKAANKELDDKLTTARADLATARVDVATARAERQSSDDKLKSTRKQLTTALGRADQAWERVERLEKRLPDPLATAVHMDPEFDLSPPDSK